MPRRSASRWNLTIANRLPWSVRATAGMPAPATACMSRGTRTMPSTSEYSVCSRRWTNAGLAGAGLGRWHARDLTAHGREAAPVKPAGTELAQARQMVLSRVALVPLEPVVRDRAPATRVMKASRAVFARIDAALISRTRGVAADDGFEAAVEAQHRAVRAAVAVHADARRARLRARAARDASRAASPAGCSARRSRRHRPSRWPRRSRSRADQHRQPLARRGVSCLGIAQAAQWAGAGPG